MLHAGSATFQASAEAKQLLKRNQKLVQGKHPEARLGVLALNQFLIAFQQLFGLGAGLKRGAASMQHKNIFCDFLLPTCLAQTQAEIEVFVVPQSKGSVQPAQLMPDIAANGDTKKITPVNRHQEVCGMRVERFPDGQPLGRAGIGLPQALPIAGRIGNGPNHGHIGRRFAHHAL